MNTTAPGAPAAPFIKYVRRQDRWSEKILVGDYRKGCEIEVYAPPPDKESRLGVFRRQGATSPRPLEGGDQSARFTLSCSFLSPRRPAPPGPPVRLCQQAGVAGPAGAAWQTPVARRPICGISGASAPQ